MQPLKNMQPVDLKNMQPDLNISTNPAETKSEKLSMEQTLVEMQTTTEEVTPQQGEQIFKARQLVDFHKSKAKLLTSPEQNALITDKDYKTEKENAELKTFHPMEEVRNIIDIIQNLFNGFVTSALGIVDIFVPVDSKANLGVGLGFAVGNELKDGAGFFAAKYQLRNLKTQLKVINQQINEIKEPSFEVNKIDLLKVQRSHLEDQIVKQEAVVREQGLSLLQTHIVSTLSSVLMLLGTSTDIAATYTAASGGLAMGVIGVGLSAYGIVSSGMAYAATNEQIATLGRVSSEHNNTNVSDALEKFNLASIAITAGHQKEQVELSIFQSSFAFCSSLAGIAGGIIGIMALAGIAVGTGTLAATGIGLPILGAAGLLIAVGLVIYNHRHSIGRGLQGLFEKSEEGKHSHSSLSPLRNLKVREWYTKFKLERSINKLENLASKHAAFSNMENTALDIASIDKQMLAKAGKIIKLSTDMEDIRYKRALQSLKDKTSSLASAKLSAIEANERALKAIDAEIIEVDKIIERLSDPKSNVKVFLELKADSIKTYEKNLEEIKPMKERIANPKEARKVFSRELSKIEIQLLELDINQVDEKGKLTNRKSELELFLKANAENPKSNIAQGIEIENENWNKLEKNLTDDLYRLKNPDENLISKLKNEYVERLNKLKTEKQLPKYNLKEVTDKLVNFKIESDVLQNEVDEKATTVVDALENSINKLNDNELNEYVTCCKAFNVKFDELSKYKNLEEKRSYVIRESVDAILHPS